MQTCQNAIAAIKDDKGHYTFPECGAPAVARVRSGGDSQDVTSFVCEDHKPVANFDNGYRYTVVEEI